MKQPQRHPGPPASQPTIRPIAPTDSLEDLTYLLHRSYRPLAEMGLRFLATHQSVEQTRSRVESGECFVAELEGNVIGTITLYTRHHGDSPEWYRREDVAHFGQFAVDPDHQGKRFGDLLLSHVERRAKELGIRELSLDTSEQAVHLIDYYKRRGWIVVGEADWDVTNYRSLILSKSIGTDESS